MAFCNKVMNIEESLVDSEGHLINTWADILNRAGTKLEALHDRSANRSTRRMRHIAYQQHRILLLSTSSRHGWNQRTCSRKPPIW